MPNISFLNLHQKQVLPRFTEIGVVLLSLGVCILYCVCVFGGIDMKVSDRTTLIIERTEREQFLPRENAFVESDVHLIAYVARKYHFVKTSTFY